MLFNLEELNAQRTSAFNCKQSSVGLDEATKPSWESFATKVNQEFDIFLSYSTHDAAIIMKIADVLREFRYSVYLDRQIDPHLDRTNVTRNTAEQIRKRLDHSKCLFYATSYLSSASKWMPWEAGYMDAKNGRVAILPVTKDVLSARADVFHGQEYLSLYPYISKEKLNGTNRVILWANESESCYCPFNKWLDGMKPIKH